MPSEEVMGHEFGVYAPIEDASGVVTQTLVAGSRSIDFEETTEMVDASHADNYDWANKMPGQQDSTLDLEHVHLVDRSTGDLDASHQALKDAKRNGDIVQVKRRRPGGKEEQVPMYVANIGISLPYDDVATNTISLEGTGAPSESDVT